MLGLRFKKDEEWLIGTLLQTYFLINNRLPEATSLGSALCLPPIGWPATSQLVIGAGNAVVYRLCVEKRDSIYPKLADDIISAAEVFVGQDKGTNLLSPKKRRLGQDFLNRLTTDMREEGIRDFAGSFPLEMLQIFGEERTARGLLAK